ncbi:MAG: hypothetical protein ACI9O3_001014 [Colwellia sp.]|jgi:hypothetical protein|uniref:hypothetical protein n=1 Tax=unclassified Colwellia TaxID=196834 RepID=UPI0015F584B6|nr:MULTISPECIES: hypothetical protein [unclassified Colwellia]MBA6253502.1 hypothetical protein [Colwellia sp. MB3u-55]MBA6397027.1 hypothetical protein [Colwellia sp. BRX10-4]
MSNKPTDGVPIKSMPRFVQVDDWIFEVKTVRAIRVDEYGKPYTAIANLTVNGDNAYIDGLLTRENEKFNRKDYAAFHQFCQQMKVKQAHFDRFKNNKLSAERADIKPIKFEAKVEAKVEAVKQTTILKLVR